MSRKLKIQTDQQVENDIITYYQTKCNEAKRARVANLNEAKRVSLLLEKYEWYLQRAEQVNMESCEQVKSFKRRIELFTQ